MTGRNTPAGMPLDIYQLRRILRMPESRCYVEAWLRWRGSSHVPTRDCMKLDDIARSLDKFSLYEVHDPDWVEVRVFGGYMRSQNLFSIEFTGKNLKDVTRPEDWPARSAHFMAMSRHPCAGIMTMSVGSASSRRHAFEIVSLPVRRQEQSPWCQVLASTIPLDKDKATTNPPRLRELGPVEDFRYVDIGLGLP